MKGAIAKKVIDQGGDGVILFDEQLKHKGTYAQGRVNTLGNGLTMSGTSVNITKKRAKFYVIEYLN